MSANDQLPAAPESEERYRTLFANMTEGFALGEAIFADTGVPCDFRFLEMNDAFERQSGLKRDEVAGRPMSEVLPHLERSWIDTYCAVALGAPARRFESYNQDLDRHFSVYCFSPKAGQFAILFTDITENKRAEAALRLASQAAEDGRRRLAAVLDALPAGVAIADKDGRVVQSNEAFTRIWGQPPETGGIDDYATWRGWWADTGERLRASDWAMARALESGKIVPGDVIEIERFDGGGRATIINAAAPIWNVEGEIVGGVVAEVDITAQKQAEKALREADQRKDEFIATLAHELRNPLAPIRYALQLLEQPSTDAHAAAQARQVIERQLRLLVRLVDELLDVARITRNKIRLRKEPVRLRALLETAIESTEPHIRAARHTLSVDLGEANPTIDGDPARLVQAFANLLNNAVKFTPPGGRISVSARVAGQEVVVKVKDSGIGIPPENLQQVFDMFHQGDNSLERAAGGLGIGLTIAKRLIEMHGGWVAASSPGVGLGAEFDVGLPVAAAVVASPPETQAPGAPAKPAALPHLRVLVVDDNVDSAEMLSMLVTLHGHEARVVHEGPGALESAARFEPHLVLLDIGLPGMNGYEVAREMRRRGSRSHLVAITGWGQEEDRRRARDAGFDCHVTKPADPSVVARLLETVAAGAPPSECCSGSLETPLTRSGDFRVTAPHRTDKDQD